jgi:hypothetical protein
MEIDMITSILPPPANVDESINDQERRGFIARSSSRLTIAHDEIAAAALEGAAEMPANEARRRIGTMMFQSAGDDAHSLRFAARHLRDAGDEKSLRQLYVRYVRLQRASGDRRSDVDLARDVLGDDSRHITPSSLTGALPVSWRLGLYSRRRFAAAVLGIIVAAGAVPAVLWSRSRNPPNAELAVFIGESDATAALYKVPVSGSTWRSGSIIDLRRSRRLASLTVPAGRTIIAVRPGTNAWTFWNAFPDSRGLDIAELQQDGRLVRLTSDSADDQQPSWSPTVDFLLFQLAGGTSWRATTSRCSIAKQGALGSSRVVMT